MRFAVIIVEILKDSEDEHELPNGRHIQLPVALKVHILDS